MSNVSNVWRVGSGIGADFATLSDALVHIHDTPATIIVEDAIAANSATSFLAALNGDTRSGGSPFTATISTVGESVILTADAVGTAGNVTITTTSAARVTVENSHGGAAAGIKRVLSVRYIVTAQDILADEVTMPIPFTPTAFVVTYTDTTGGLKAATWLATIQAAPARIRVAKSGATNLIAGDVILLTVWE